MSGDETPTTVELGDEAESFEGALSALEDRVRKLEAGEISLDEGLPLYEQGVALARRCHGLLDAAEQRVSAVVRGGEGPELRPLDEPE